MLISACAHNSLLIFPTLNYGISIRNSSNTAYLKKTLLTLNAAAPVIQDTCSPGPCDLQFNYDRRASNLVRFNDTHAVMSYRLGVFRYTYMDGQRLVNGGNPINFKYVICIDASTCIAADDTGNDVKYYNVSNYVKYGGSADEVLLVQGDHEGYIGLAGSSALKSIILCTTNYCYIRNYASNAVAKFSTPNARDFAFFFDSATPAESVVAVVFENKINFYKPFSPSFASSNNASFASTPIADGWANQIKITDSGKYVALTIWNTNLLYLYEKKPCHTSCATCSGPNDNDCQTCVAPNSWLDSVNKRCSPCNGSTEVKLANMVCGRCGPDCTQCLSSNKNNCTACVVNRYLSNSNTCVACTANTTVVVSPRCVSCTAPCVTCEGTPTTCTSCTGGNCLNIDIGTGVCSRASNYIAEGTYLYQSGTVQTCGACPANCMNCTNALICAACSPGMYSSGGNCFACPAECSRCNSATDCTSCNIGHLLIKDTNGICDPCEIDMLYVTQDGRCDNCDSTCGACNNTADNCTKCRDPTTQYVYEDGKCAACVDGNFISDIYCLPCSSSCRTCVESSDICTSCNLGEYLQGNTSECDVCLTENGVYVASNWICQDCSDNCATCKTNSTNCLSCNGTLVVSDSNGTCGECGEGYFISSADRKCYKCSTNCLACREAADQCYSCNSSQYINSESGCESCMRLYVGIVDEFCVECEPESNCLRCDGNSSKCTECAPDMNLTIMTADNNKCGNNCNATGGSYIETVSGVSYCKQCDSSCEQCLGTANTCTKCAENLQLINSTCLACGLNCRSCDSPNHCLECHPSFFMLPNTSCISQTQCKQFEKRFVNGLNCSDCGDNCKSCFGSAASCTSCIAGQYLSATNTCVPCTENGYYHNSTNCLQCDSSCLTCNGSTSTDCRSCIDSLVLTDKRSCENIPPLSLKSSTFKSDMELAIITFDHPIKVRALEPKIGLYTCSISTLVAQLNTTLGLPGAGSACEPFGEWGVKEVLYDESQLKVKLVLQKTIEGGILVVRAAEKNWWQAQSNNLIRYPEDYLIVENVTVIKSALDGMMDSAAAPAAAAMTTVQLVVMTVSTPQAFILMKVLQTLDYYIYIDCNYPSNFAKFLDMITNSAFDYLPNFFEMLVDNDGLPLYERFAEYGMKVHIFANLGQIYSIAMILGALKLLFLMATKVWSKAGKYYNAVGPEVFFGLFESYNLDSMLSVIIFIANRERINNRQDAVKYLVIVFVSLFSLFMISMYLFMGYTVSRLTDSYFKHAVVEVKDMKNERWKFLLEDKNMHGNIFQRHFNLIQLFKDIVFAALLYALYYKPLVLIILLTLIQAVYATAVLAFPPYCIPWMNLSLKITQVLYLILDLFFFLLIAWGGQFTEKTRYYLIGFSMIVLVLMILACNIGFGLYSTVIELRKKYLKYKVKKGKKLNNQAKDKQSNLNASAINSSQLSTTQNLPNETSISVITSKPLVNRHRNKKSTQNNDISPLISDSPALKKTRLNRIAVKRTLRKVTDSIIGPKSITKQNNQTSLTSQSNHQSQKSRIKRAMKNSILSSKIPRISALDDISQSQLSSKI